MKKFLITAVFAFIGSVVFAQERIAVFPFEDMDKVFKGNEATMFYSQFTNELRNRISGRYTIVPREDYERLIKFEANFQLSDFSAREKTAEMNQVLNGTQILSGKIARIGNNIQIIISLHKYPELAVLPGGASVSVANINELFDKIPELVQKMLTEMSGGRTTVNPAGGAAPANFVRIQGGTFTMGSPSNEPQRNSDEVQHQVTVNSFYMSKHEVTQKEYQEVMGTNPSKFKGDNLPVENVSWYDAIEYCIRRSEREGLTPAYTIDKGRSDPNNRSEYDNVRWVVTWNRNANGYRLPTEAEWEYACRAGTVTPFNTGNNIPTSLANYDGNYPYNNNSKGTYRERTTAVGNFAPNPWGLYDMHGNVWEWCWDWYGGYAAGAQTDPLGAVSGSDRVVRSGSWNYYGHFLRSAVRGLGSPSGRVSFLGFRLVRP